MQVINRKKEKRYRDLKRMEFEQALDIKRAARARKRARRRARVDSLGTIGELLEGK